MKRFFIYALCASMILCMTACGKKNDNQTEPAETTTAITTAPTVYENTESTVAVNVPEYQPPMSAVSMPTVKETLNAEDGTLIFTYTYQNVFPILQDPNVADSVSLDLLNRIDASRSLAESVKSIAKVNYENSSSWTPYFCSVYYNPMRIDQGVLSLFGSQISYQGGSHPTHLAISATYDLVTGKALSFTDILDPEYSATQLSQLIVDALGSVSVSLYPDYEDIITDRFAGTHSSTENWYLSQNGLSLYFSPYDIAPYSSGIVVAEIPYSSLNGILKDAYFPAERGNYEGSIIISSFEETDLSKFNQFAELILNREGETSLLYTDGTIFDVRIETGSYTESSNAFIPTATVFACESLSHGEAVMIQKDQVLRLSYTSNGEKFSELLK